MANPIKNVEVTAYCYAVGSGAFHSFQIKHHPVLFSFAYTLANACVHFHVTDTFWKKVTSVLSYFQRRPFVVSPFPRQSGGSSRASSGASSPISKDSNPKVHCSGKFCLTELLQCTWALSEWTSALSKSSCRNSFLLFLPASISYRLFWGQGSIMACIQCI